MTPVEKSIFDPEILAPAAVLATFTVLWIKFLISTMKENEKDRDDD